MCASLRTFVSSRSAAFRGASTVYIYVGPADDLVQLARVINPSLQRWQSRRRRATTVPICLDLLTARRVSAGCMAPPFCAAPRSVQLDLPERRRGNGRKMLAY